MAEMREAKIPGELFCLATMFPRDDSDRTSTSNNPLVAYKASTHPDTMYMHEAMKEPDNVEFKTAMHKEFNTHIKAGNFVIVRRDQVPKGKTILP